MLQEKAKEGHGSADPFMAPGIRRRGMKITEIRLGSISVPLRVPFKTALRTVTRVEDIILEIHTDTGAVGYGEAPPTGAVTGHTTGAIVGALKDHIIPNLLGKEVDAFEDLMQLV